VERTESLRAKDGESEDSVYWRLRMVLEDELIWAAEEQGVPLPEEATRYYSFVEDGKEKIAADMDKEGIRTANRAFTLAWRNEWKDHAENVSGFVQKAKEWETMVLPDVLALLGNDPSSIDPNLDYHWHHFITQRALVVLNMQWSCNYLSREGKGSAGSSSLPVKHCPESDHGHFLR